jgi:hypothetical protein
MFKKISIAALLMAGLALGANHAGGQSHTSAQRSERKLQPFFFGTAPNLPVLGGGTMGQLTMWTGFNSANSVIGDSIITQTKLGRIGIGTTAPTSTLTVEGMIETTTGGFKFPDGTVQTTSSSSALFGVSHDPTLSGAGTSASPLSVAVSLNLSGAVLSNGATRDAVIKATNTTDSGDGITGFGGPGPTTGGGTGVNAIGGTSAFFVGGSGIFASGGSGDTSGGPGVNAFGGQGDNNDGGDAVIANAGPGKLFGGSGVSATGGNHLDNSDGNGGNGVGAIGGTGSGLGLRSGNGLVASGGKGVNGAADGLAGDFLGDVSISGNLSVTGTKNFRIDHPLDPENKYLYHAAVESSEVLNVYTGNITTDETGNAEVALPDWFDAVNRDFRYQLTVVGQFAQAIVAAKIKNNHFTIRTDAPNVEVSWLVTGVRSDPGLLKHPFKVEEDKPDYERGYYLSPDAYGQPEERGVEWARNPQLMQRVKEQREVIKQRN